MKITRGRIPGAKKVVVYGPEGIGKSTFASRFPEPLFIDTEGSTKELDVARTPTPTSWTMLKEQIRYVIDHPDICKTLVVDTIDWAEQMCVEDICASHQKKGIEDFGYGNGYVYVREEFGRFLNLLGEVVGKGVHVVLTAHAQMRKFEQPDELGSYDRWEMKLGKKTSSQTSPLVKEWADMLLFANYKTHAVAVDKDGKKHKAQGGRRVMYTQHHPCWDAKNRYGLPEEADFDYQVIVGIIEPSPSGRTERTEGTHRETPAAIPEKPSAAETKKLPTQNPTGPKEGNPSPEPSKPDPSRKEPEGQMEMGLAERAGTASPPPETPATGEKDSLKLDPRIPKALRDLMEASKVSEWDLCMVMEAKGYVPAETPVWEFDQVNPGIVEGLLVPSWNQVLAAIKEMWDKTEIPFDQD